LAIGKDKLNSIPITLNGRPETLIEQARLLVNTRADETCAVLVQPDGEYALSYGAFFARAGQYAQALQAAGIQRGDLAVLVLPHGEAVMGGFWGALLMGAIPSIFPFLSDKQDPARYFSTVRQLVEHSGVKALITSTEFEQPLRAALAGLDTAMVLVDDLETPPHDPLPAPQGLPLVASREGEKSRVILRDDGVWSFTVNGDDTAFLQHSSGSTGLQKGVMLSHRAVINQVASYSAAIHLAPDDVVVSWLPLYHDMGLIAGFILPILQGVKLVIMSPFQWVRDPKILLHAIQRQRATLCWLPNFAYNFLATRVRDADIEGLDLSSMRAFVNCSEPVYADSHRQFAERYTPYGLRPDALTTCYAMAENTFAVTQSGIESPATLDVVDRRLLAEARRAVPATGHAATVTLVSCGQPIPNCAIQVVDEQRQPVSERHVGEIALRSNSMLSGYYRRPDATSEVLADGWYYTGDMGYIAGGELYITGRKKDLIIVGGKNVYPQDIENLLNDIPGLHPGRASAFGVFNEQLGTEDIAIVAEVDAEDVETRAAISREIRARVAQNTEVTARYVRLVGAGWLVKTTSGKVARGANKEKFIREFLEPPDVQNIRLTKNQVR
jgi:acyl-CoA synthetase (AMP-forming)/AMP-acid ligase II